MKHYMRLFLGILIITVVCGTSTMVSAATSAKKVSSTKKVITKKTSTVKKKVVKKKGTAKKKVVKKKKEVLNLNPPLIDPANPPGGR